MTMETVSCGECLFKCCLNCKNLSHKSNQSLWLANDTWVKWTSLNIKTEAQFAKPLSHRLRPFIYVVEEVSNRHRNPTITDYSLCHDLSLFSFPLGGNSTILTLLTCVPTFIPLRFVCQESLHSLFPLTWPQNPVVKDNACGTDYDLSERSLRVPPVKSLSSCLEQNLMIL